MANKKFLNKIKLMLLSQKNEILKPILLEDIDTDGDETDEIQGNMLIELTTQLSARNNLKLMKINQALKKINENTFGDCEDCGEEIAEKRLLLSPYLPTCVFCAEERELSEKQRKRE